MPKKLVNCKHYRKSGHKKKFCWKLEANKSKQPKWWTDMAAVSIEDEGKIIL